MSPNLEYFIPYVNASNVGSGVDVGLKTVSDDVSDIGSFDIRELAEITSCLPAILRSLVFCKLIFKIGNAFYIHYAQIKA